VYRPLVEQTLQRTTSRAAIDYGTGRGEWLELLNEIGWSARGVDSNEDMVSFCRALALNVDHDDVLTHASHLGDGGTGLITAFHLIEHLPIEQAFTLTRNAYRALCDSGMLILETPNPENVMVGTWGFYMDPTHVRPLPPDLLRFLVESAGFSIARIVRLYGDVPAATEDVTFASVFRHPIASGPDYAVIAIKSPKPDQSESLEKFVREIGQRRPTDFSQAERLDNRWAIIERQVNVLEAALAKLEAALAATTAGYNAILASTSWKITAPIRWLARVLRGRP